MRLKMTRTEIKDATHRLKVKKFERAEVSIWANKNFCR